MKHAQRSELREILLQLVAQRASLERLRREAGKDLSFDESLTISETEDELKKCNQNIDEGNVMANKRNIRSIRFSDDLAELIDRQQGQNFTEKFENLITRCVWELPAKEKELAALEEHIQERRAQLLRMSAQAGELGAAINELFPKVFALENAIDNAVKKWEV